MWGGGGGGGAAPGYGGGAGTQFGVYTATFGSNGGSGVVILRYSNVYANAVATTGSPSFSDTGGYKIYRFTGSGSIRW